MYALAASGSALRAAAPKGVHAGHSPKVRTTAARCSSASPPLGIGRSALPRRVHAVSSRSTPGIITTGARRSVHGRRSPAVKVAAIGSSPPVPLEPSFARKRRKVESESIPKEVRESVIDAIESLGGKVTVGDVAAAAGVKVGQAESTLTALAADTGAVLEVSPAGDLLYVFSSGIRNTLSGKSLKLRVEPALETAQKVGGYLARVSFGTTLIASVAVVYASIFALLSGRDDRDRDDRGGGFGGGYTGMGPGFYWSPMDFFWYWDPYYYERRAQQAALEGARDMSFLEAVFSFVFGDGDPNANFERRRWALVGYTIQKNKGVVCAEQLAPFLEPTDEERQSEAYVLPALTRFQGHPEIDDKGNIVYRFPSMEATSGVYREIQAEVEAAGAGGYSLGVAEEERYKFSLATRAQRLMAAALGVFNFVGVSVLTGLVNNPEIVMKKAALVGAINGFLPALQVYAAFFFAVPLLRNMIIQRRNAEIDARNRERLFASKEVARPDAALEEKLSSVRRAASQRTVRSEDSVFSTNRDVGDYEADEFDRRLRDLK